MKREVIIFILVVDLMIAIPAIFLQKRHIQKQRENQHQNQPDAPPENPTPPEEKPPEKPPETEPEWTTHNPIRQVNNLGKVLSDIDSHMKAGHIYSDADKITWAHETTHGINSDLRQKFSGGGLVCTAFIDAKPVFKSMSGINGFYCLDNRACMIQEPKTTIIAAAQLVPASLKGSSYNLYMLQSKAWNDTPLYVFDEWSAYTNGSACRLDLGIKPRSETVLQMLEFNVYAICVAQASNSEDPQFQAFLRWQLRRTMSVYAESREKLDSADQHDAYLAKMRTANDADNWRRFTKKYLGEEWTKEVLGF